MMFFRDVLRITCVVNNRFFMYSIIDNSDRALSKIHPFVNTKCVEQVGNKGCDICRMNIMFTMKLHRIV